MIRLLRRLGFWGTVSQACRMFVLLMILSVFLFLAKESISLPLDIHAAFQIATDPARQTTTPENAIAKLDSLGEVLASIEAMIGGGLLCRILLRAWGRGVFDLDVDSSSLDTAAGFAGGAVAWLGGIIAASFAWGGFLPFYYWCDAALHTIFVKATKILL